MHINLYEDVLEMPQANLHSAHDFNRKDIDIQQFLLSFSSILFTKSRGYLDIKNCSTYKNNDTHLKQPVFIRQIYLRTICMKVWKLYPFT